MGVSSKWQEINRQILLEGDKVENTFELQGFSQFFEDVKLEDFEGCRRLEEIELFYSYFRENRANESRVVGNYVVNKYSFIHDEMEYVVKRFSENGLNTRQAVVIFPREHCFESIQFLERGTNILTIVNMRSCNFRENFIGDLYLAYRLTLELEIRLKRYFHTIDIQMNIGSLHIFEEDAADRSRLIIVEGIDRVGKSTLCEKLATELNAKIKKYSSFADLDEKDENNPEDYNSLKILKVLDELETEPGISVIDRLHFTERAYGEAYRNYISKYYEQIANRLENNQNVLVILVNPNQLEESNRQHGKDQTKCCMIMNQLYGEYSGNKLSCDYSTIDDAVEKAKEWVESR